MKAPMPTEIDRHRVRELVERGAQLVDVLPAEIYDDEHLPGAINLPLDRLDAEAHQALRRDAPIITYCHDYQ
jgi:rhodanese-related sulfurtransferase